MRGAEMAGPAMLSTWYITVGNQLQFTSGRSRWQCWAAAAFCSANLRAGYVPGIVVVVIVFEYRIGRLFRAEKSVSGPSIKELTPLGEQWGIRRLS